MTNSFLEYAVPGTGLFNQTRTSLKISYLRWPDVSGLPRPLAGGPEEDVGPPVPDSWCRPRTPRIRFARPVASLPSTTPGLAGW